MRIKLLLIPLVALAGVLGVSSYAHALDAPQTRTVKVGGGGSGIAANGFFPSTITMRKGDTIHFLNPYEELHTTTYVPGVPEPMPVPPLLIGPNFNPLALEPTSTGVTDFDPHEYYNSGFMFKDATSDVIFNGLGSFKFLCLLHPGMELTVDVIQSTPDLPSQVEIDAKGDAERDAIIRAGTGLAAGVSLTKVTDASGTSTFDMQIGGGEGKADIMQFLPSGPLNISTGDSVRWTSANLTPHTVTFGDAPPIIGDTGFGPGALPSGDTTFGGGSANSGVMDSSGEVPGGSSYSLTFTKAGTYTYVCLLHADQGMASTVVVSDRAAAPTPRSGIGAPDTGAGPVSEGSWLPSLLMLAFAGVALLAVGARGVGRRQA